jgi:hypothetical protein
MPLEQFADAAQTTLNGSIDNSQTTLTLTSTSNFSSVPNFRIIIGSELMKVTGVAGSVLTVERGAEGSSAASHADLAVVTQVVTAGALNQLRLDALATDSIIYTLYGGL